MAGTVAKGNRLQVMSRKILEADGYVVHTAVRSSQRVGPPWKPFWISQTTDIFNAFDLIATRIDGPRPLRFIQITGGSVSERVKKVDPVPINTAIASVEVWKWHGGRKRLDRRYKDRKVWLPRGYFQVYYKERNWEPDPGDRIATGDAPAARASEEPVPIEPTAIAPALVRAKRVRVRGQA
ncbi:MAG: hypothetical protein E6K10_09495 [Methanobacteriota archaeon]|nr:MAG: hypothetical protein E6K10_09495 [Euryarchaeota archaeon]